MTNRVAVIVAVMLLDSAPASSQWLNHPIQGLARLPDGRPDLNATAPTIADGRARARNRG